MSHLIVSSGFFNEVKRRFKRGNGEWILLSWLAACERGASDVSSKQGQYRTLVRFAIAQLAN